MVCQPRVRVEAEQGFKKGLCSSRWDPRAQEWMSGGQSVCEGLVGLYPETLALPGVGRKLDALVKSGKQGLGLAGNAAHLKSGQSQQDGIGLWPVCPDGGNQSDLVGGSV